MVEAITPGSIQQSVGGFINFAGVNAQIILWTEYFLISFLIIGILFGVYFWLQYKYKVYHPKLVFEADRKIARIVGWKKDRARILKKRGIKMQRFLWSRKTIEPFRIEDILPGNKVYLFRVNDDGTYVSMPPLNVESAKFETVSSEENFWAIMQLKENAKAYQDVDLQKRMLVYTMVTIMLCLAMVIFTVWLCLKAPNKVADSMNAIRPSLDGFLNRIGGTPPA